MSPGAIPAVPGTFVFGRVCARMADIRVQWQAAEPTDGFWDILIPGIEMLAEKCRKGFSKAPCRPPPRALSQKNIRNALSNRFSFRRIYVCICAYIELFG